MPHKNQRHFVHALEEFMESGNTNQEELEKYHEQALMRKSIPIMIYSNPLNFSLKIFKY